MFAGGRGGQAGSGRRQRSAAGQDWTPGEEEEGVVHLALAVSSCLQLSFVKSEKKTVNNNLHNNKSVKVFVFIVNLDRVYNKSSGHRYPETVSYYKVLPSWLTLPR